MSHNPYHNPVVWLLLFSFQRWGHSVTEMLSNFPRATQWHSDGESVHRNGPCFLAHWKSTEKQTILMWHSRSYPKNKPFLNRGDTFFFFSFFKSKDRNTVCSNSCLTVSLPPTPAPRNQTRNNLCWALASIVPECFLTRIFAYSPSELKNGAQRDICKITR